MTLAEFYAHCAVFLLTAVSCARIFFLREIRRDSFAMFPICALFFEIAIFFCYGLSIFSIFGIFLTLLVFVTNFRAFCRLCSNLFVSHYNPIFIIFSVLELIFAIFAIFVLFLAFPVKFDAKNLKELGVQKQIFDLQGTRQSGFSIKQKIFQPKTGIVQIFSPNSISANSDFDSENFSAKKMPAILFVCPVTATLTDYEFFLASLSKNGFKVFAADFSCAFLQKSFSFFGNNFLESSLFRKFFSRILKIFWPEEFSLLLLRDSNSFAQKNFLLSQFAKEFLKSESDFFIVTDDAPLNANEFIYDLFGTNAITIFELSKITEYKTSGFGFLEQTNPLFARKFSLSRDKTFFIPRYVANTTANEFKKFLTDF